MIRILILRPRPGADETAARAAQLALDFVIAPLFSVRQCPWQVPDPDLYDALMLTSANAVRHAGDAVTSLRSLPCYAVGARTAVEAQQAGFADVRAGSCNAAGLIALMAQDGVRRALHLCGRDRTDTDDPTIKVDRIVVYAADPVAALPEEAVDAARGGAIALLHSPRAASLFGDLVDRAGLARGRIALAAISMAAAEAAGTGWAVSAVATAPSDQALLEVAAELCKISPSETGPVDGL